jgi:hypothetical protein
MSDSIADVTVVTPCIPERAFLKGSGNGMLGDCIASVEAQLVKPRRHIIAIDYERVGCARMMNDLVQAVDTEWIVPLADDDLLLKGYIAEMVTAAGNSAVTYSRPIAVGADWAPRRYDFSAVELRKENYIPSTALIRTEMWRKVGGYRSAQDAKGERFFDEWRMRSNFTEDMFPDDWDFWLRCLDARGHFRHVPSRNWVYRMHPGNLFNQPKLRGDSTRETQPAPRLQEPSAATSG